MALFYTERIPLHTLELFANKQVRKYFSPKKMALFGNKMIYKQYGKTGKNVSAVGFGGMRFDTKLSNDKNAELLLYAYDKGINYFDTAPIYCQDRSEDIYGIAMKQMRNVRDRIYVSTKGMPTEIRTAAQARAAVEKSLKRLNLEKIDFYFVWCVRKVEHYEMAMKKGGLYDGLLECKEQGLIDHIAISSHLTGENTSRVLEKGEFDGVLLGVNILNFLYRWEGVLRASEMGLGVLAMNPLAGGAIPEYADRLKFLSGEDETPVEAALRFCVSCPQITVALNGFTTREHIDMACRVADSSRPFSPKEIERIKKHLAENMNSLCTGCGYCLEGCPEKIPIASYMQFYNQKTMFGKSDDEMMEDIDLQHNWQLLAERAADAADCSECGRCEEACTQHLNIIERLREIAQWEKKAH